MYNVKGNYQDGYEYGLKNAEANFKWWLSHNDPPIPWPKTLLERLQFVEVCAPEMETVFVKNIGEDLYKQGVSLQDIVIPRELIRGVNAGHRTRLLELLNQHFADWVPPWLR
jgi:hypothetical protein